ncbi:MAG: hypothetical protein R3C26_14705 [Calditrichia bacterium]
MTAFFRKTTIYHALRQTWTGALNLSFVFWLWLPFAGFHPLMVMTMQSVSLVTNSGFTQAVGSWDFWNGCGTRHRTPGASRVGCEISRPSRRDLIIWDA